MYSKEKKRYIAKYYKLDYNYKRKNFENEIKIDKFI